MKIVDHIKQLSAGIYGVEASLFEQRRGPAEVVKAKHIALYILMYFGFKPSQLATYFGIKRSAVYRAVVTADTELVYPEGRERLMALCHQLCLDYEDVFNYRYRCKNEHKSKNSKAATGTGSHERSFHDQADQQHDNQIKTEV